MNYKRNNWLFLIFILALLVMMVMMSLVNIEDEVSFLVFYVVSFGVGMLFLRKDEATFFEVLPCNVKLKPMTALLIVALTFASMPLSQVLSFLGSLIAGPLLKEEMKMIQQQYADPIVQILTIAVIPAVFEEMFFRGFFYAGFKRARGARTAIILSSILFGFFHMNVEQVIYASVLGIIIAVLREVTGSLWSGMLFHFINNGWSVIPSCLREGSSAKVFFDKLPIERMGFDSAPEALHTIGMLVLCTALSVFLLILIARKEDRIEDLKTFFQPKKEELPAETVPQANETVQAAPAKKPVLFSAPLIIAMIVLAVVTLIMLVLSMFLRILPPEMTWLTNLPPEAFGV